MNPGSLESNKISVFNKGTDHGGRLIRRKKAGLYTKKQTATTNRNTWIKT